MVVVDAADTGAEVVAEAVAVIAAAVDAAAVVAGVVIAAVAAAIAAIAGNRFAPLFALLFFPFSSLAPGVCVLLSVPGAFPRFPVGRSLLLAPQIFTAPNNFSGCAISLVVVSRQFAPAVSSFMRPLFEFPLPITMLRFTEFVRETFRGVMGLKHQADFFSRSLLRGV